MIKNLVNKTRSCRRFHQDKINTETLRELVNLTRFCPSAANLQPLKYIISNEPEKNELIYKHLAWAGYLKDWPGPEENEKPTGYIIILGDTTIREQCDYDAGIAAYTILLSATERGLGGCMFASVQREKLCKALNVPENLKIALVVALGKPKEKVVLEPIGSNGDIKYWRDEQAVHHVPKRALGEIIID